jgi:AcrR family transcriptional regulator
MSDLFSPRKPVRQSRARETVDAILEAAARLVNGDGGASPTFSTNRIAELAGVSIGSLYQYFPGKDAILHALVEREFNAVVDAHVTFIDAIDTTSVPLAEAIGLLVDRVFAGVASRRPLYRQLALSVLSIRHLAFTLDNDSRVREAVRRKLATYPDVDQENLEAVTFVTLHALKGVQIGAVLSNRPLEDTALREATVRALLACAAPCLVSVRSRVGTD